MKKKYRLGIIGGGVMAQAITDGALACGYLSAQEISLSEPNCRRARVFAEKGINILAFNRDVAESCDYLLLSVKPQVFTDIAKELCGVEVSVVISIMAGVEKNFVRETMKCGNVKIARAMPNLACSVGAGMTGLDVCELLPSDKEFVTGLFSSTGKVNILEEKLMNAVTSISGSGPAYVFLFLRSLVLAGMEQGFTESQAKEFALQTLKGGVKLVENSVSGTLEELIEAVSSKGGTTVAALESFRKDDFAGAVSRAVAAAVRRAEELSE